MRVRRVFLLLLLGVLAGSACGRRQVASRPPSSRSVPAPTTADPLPPGYAETGYASWYGDPYHGRRAANGEVYDKNKLTAAHLTMPFETQVKVTNLENNRSVNVRITDRGPFVKGRIIDVSQEAARQLQMIANGTALVRLEVLAASAETASGSYAVQVASFRDRAAAEELQRSLAMRYGGAFVEPFEGDNGLFYRVRVGPKASAREAQALATELGRVNLPGFIVRLTD